MDSENFAMVNVLENYSDDELKAAYALNYCTVSISQIIDYKDINILEQEYNAILNNLNLEIIPKDEALLNILKQLLDAITFFRISEVEKSFIDREYQLRVQNAIWGAAPQFGICIATGNPLAIAASFLSQVGIGYMNYRSNMQSYILEKDKKMWQLQRTAIEQFNGLRRELFDTAWRMTSDHSMHDILRLTENQINQLNSILKDEDILRKYERLDNIKEYFIAYPPFWYQFGSAAYYLYTTDTIIYEDEVLEKAEKNRYLTRAKECFDFYWKLIDNRSILREDTISAACALANADLLISENKDENISEILKFLEKAEKKSGYAFDVMEMCAIEYLKINDMDNASRLLRRLVNEDYNTIINAQLLSSIYVRTRKISEYKLLQSRVPSEFLYIMPEQAEYTDNMIEAAGQDFEEGQKELLKKRYKDGIAALIEKYVVKWNRFTSTFDLEEEYPADFYSASGISLTKRIIEARRVFSIDYKKSLYLERMAEDGLELTLVDYLNDFTDELFSLKAISDTNVQQEFVDSVEERRIELRQLLDNYTRVIESKDNFNIEQYSDMQKKIHFETFIREGIVEVIENHIDAIIKQLTMDDMASMEEELRVFCRNSEISNQVIFDGADKEENLSFNDERKFFEVSDKQKRVVKNRKFIEQMESAAKDYIVKQSFIDDVNNIRVIFRSDREFDNYFASLMFEKCPALRSHTFMVLSDKRKVSMDLAFTTEGIVPVYFGKARQKCSYKEVFYNKKTKMIHFAGLLTRYNCSGINTEALYRFINFLDKRFINDLELRTKYFTEDTVVNFSEIYNWLMENGSVISEMRKCVIAYPDTKTLFNLGYRFSREYDRDSNLLQFFYDEETGSVDDLHIISFVKIDTSFQQQIEEHDGFMVIE